MTTRDEILEAIRQRKQVTSRELQDRFGVTRQALHLHLKKLVESGAILKEGQTRGATYRVATGKERAPSPTFRRRFPLAGLQEDRVYKDLEIFLGLERALSRTALEASRYGFTEMLNNAIDHSRADFCQVEAAVTAYTFRFRIRDRGLGVFQTIAAKFELPDEAIAAGELLKGRTTTMPERHTGEGIFFTSRAADRFVLRSHRIELAFDNLIPDVFLSEKRSLSGTEVSFEIARRSKRSLASGKASPTRCSGSSGRVIQERRSGSRTSPRPLRR